MIQVLIRPPFEDELSAQDVERIGQAVLDAEAVSPGVSLSIVVTDDDEIRALNQQFRGMDSPTDVLAFADDAPETTFVSPSDEPPYLGDVVLSYPRARSQAEEQGHGVARELRLLIVHGVLHLLGYDHDTADREAQMWAKQDEILSSVNDD
jgi:probable rRNA maturation factor